MASRSTESVNEAFEVLPPDSPGDDTALIEERPKLKSHQRLLQSLQRISSSPSVAKQNRGSSNYRIGGRGSVSCVSLASASPGAYHYWPNYTTHPSNGWSTAPTSVPQTPGLEPMDNHVQFRLVCEEWKKSGGLQPIIFSPSGTATGDYFSLPVSSFKVRNRRENFDFWGEMPPELKMQILKLLKPKDIVRCSAVSKSWYTMCFDGQLWADLDTTHFYRDIPGDALAKIISSAGPFVRDLNLRGCVQLRERWAASNLSDACKNLRNLSIEGCKIDRNSLHTFLYQNAQLSHINLCGLQIVSNSTLKIIAQYCPKVEYLNISWCSNVDTRGLRKIVIGCANIKDLRVGEIRGFEDMDVMLDLFRSNTLERLLMTNCDSLTDESLCALMEGEESDIDYLTGRRVVPPRKLKHIDLSRCRNITDKGIKSLAFNVPELEGLQLSKCRGITDDALTTIFPTLPKLTHLDLEELDEITNASLQSLAASPCKDYLEHLSISYCENLGDVGMLPVVKNCVRLQNLDMDNTRISDLVLVEAASMVRSRALQISASYGRPQIGLRMVVFDCQNVTWTGVREVLSRNAEIKKPTATSSTYPSEIIKLKCFYGWQMTVEQHTKRVLRGDLAAASRLERMWAESMMAHEEAGAAGGSRRRRRRAREAQMMHADEEEGGMGSGGVGRRRRARSGGCTVM